MVSLVQIGVGSDQGIAAACENKTVNFFRQPGSVAKNYLSGHGIDTNLVQFYTHPNNDNYFARDHGATFIVNKSGKPGVADFSWNGYNTPGWLTANLTDVKGCDDRVCVTFFSPLYFPTWHKL